MADYTLPEVVEKRVRYFDGQFLQDQDFVDEQDYQLDREHRHIRLLHGPGIADGLTVTSTAPNQVSVTAGTAVDIDGNQLALAQATTVDLPAQDFDDKQGIELYISYLVSAEDPQTVAGSADFTRWLERPQLTALAPGQAFSGTSSPVLLATLALDNAGRVAVDSTVRSYSGLRLPGSAADPVTLTATSAGPAQLSGALNIDGSLGLDVPSSPSQVNALQIDVQSFVTEANAIASYFMNVRDVGAGPPGNYFCIRGDGAVGVGTPTPGARLDVVGGGGLSVDLQVNGRLRSNNNDGGLWVAADRFVGGFDTSKIGFYNGNAWRLAVLSTGNVGIGAANPANDLEIGSYDPQDRYLALKVAGGNAHISGIKMWTWQENYGYSLMYDERNTTGNGLHIKMHNIDPDGTTKLFFGWNGNIGINTTTPAASLHLDVPSSSAPVNALQIDVESFVTGTNAAASYFMRVRDVGASGFTHFCIKGNGSVGIGTTDTGSQKLVVAGQTWLQGGLYAGGGFWYQMQDGNWWGIGPAQSLGAWWVSTGHADGPNPSDVRLKADLRPISDALELVRKLNGVRYRWGEAGLGHFTRDIGSSVSAGPGATDEQNQEIRQAERRKALDALAGDRIGLVAQDVEAVLPELVRADEDGYKHIRYQHLTALLTEAIKEQDAVVQALSAKVAALQATQSSDTTGA
jgi:hypothetical protein